MFLVYQGNGVIIVEFYGGLGNQMLQYAFYKALKEKYPLTKIKVDITRCTAHYGFELPKIFDIKLDVVTKWEYIKLGKMILLFNSNGFIQKILNSIICSFIKYKQNKLIYMRDENFFNFNSKYFNLDTKSNYYLSSCWFTEGYFNHIKEMLLLDFQIPESTYNSSVLKGITNSESVSVHLRRGDYINTEYDVLTIDYYKKAIDYINSKVNSPLFFIFSNDIEYAENAFNFLQNKVIVSENQGQDSYKDIFFMSKCKHNINANSSFSFWGAYLNCNKNKIVIAPNIYLRSREDYPTCTGWEIIDCKNNYPEVKVI